MAGSLPPSTMRAWQYSSSKGGLEKNLKINSSARVPKPKASQHLVQITATALNPIDYKPAEKIPGVTQFLISKPATPGIDFAGTIVTPASGSTLKAGQLVFGASGASPLAGGALVEFNVSGTDSTVALPDNLDPIDAATIGVAALSAYQSIVPHVKEGDKIFINGGSGGTGVFGIQFAKVLGCHVTTTCSATNVELCKSLGADKVVDYKKESVLEALKNGGHKFNHAVDNVGMDTELTWQSHEFMQSGAVFITVGAEPTLAGVADSVKRKLWPGFLGGMKGNVTGFWPSPKREDFQQIGDWMSTGKVRSVIDQKFEFEQAPQAIEKLKMGRAKGKIVIDVASKTYTKAST